MAKRVMWAVLLSFGVSTEGFSPGGEESRGDGWAKADLSSVEEETEDGFCALSKKKRTTRYDNDPKSLPYVDAPERGSDTVSDVGSGSAKSDLARAAVMENAQRALQSSLQRSVTSSEGASGAAAAPPDLAGVSPEFLWPTHADITVTDATEEEQLAEDLPPNALEALAASLPSPGAVGGEQPERLGSAADKLVQDSRLMGPANTRSKSITGSPLSSLSETSAVETVPLADHLKGGRVKKRISLKRLCTDNADYKRELAARRALDVQRGREEAQIEHEEAHRQEIEAFQASIKRLEEEVARGRLHQVQQELLQRAIEVAKARRQEDLTALREENQRLRESAQEREAGLLQDQRVQTVLQAREVAALRSDLTEAGRAKALLEEALEEQKRQAEAERKLRADERKREGAAWKEEEARLKQELAAQRVSIAEQKEREEVRESELLSQLAEIERLEKEEEARGRAVEALHEESERLKKAVEEKTSLEKTEKARAKQEAEARSVLEAKVAKAEEESARKVAALQADIASLEKKAADKERSRKAEEARLKQELAAQNVRAREQEVLKEHREQQAVFDLLLERALEEEREKFAEAQKEREAEHGREMSALRSECLWSEKEFASLREENVRLQQERVEQERLKEAAQERSRRKTEAHKRDTALLRVENVRLQKEVEKFSKRKTPAQIGSERARRAHDEGYQRKLLMLKEKVKRLEKEATDKERSRKVEEARLKGELAAQNVRLRDQGVQEERFKREIEVLRGANLRLKRKGVAEPERLAHAAREQEERDRREAVKRSGREVAAQRARKMPGHEERDAALARSAEASEERARRAREERKRSDKTIARETPFSDVTALWRERLGMSAQERDEMRESWRRDANSEGRSL